MKLEGIKLLTDEPIGEKNDLRPDGLGFDTYARVLARSALGTPGPFTIGIFGEWGTGKTSLLRMIKRELDTQPEVATIWFNAWQYEQEEHPIVPLIATMLQGVQAKWGFLDKLGERGQRLLNSLRAVAYGSSFKTSIGLPKAANVEAVLSGKDVIDKAAELSSDKLLEGSIHYQAFAKLEQIDLGEDIRIVVLIDDLDRCMPDRAIKLLESIKLVLSQPGFIFILGVSREVIEGYLEHRYAIEYGIQDFRGRTYLDKIVQLPFGIPPHSGRMEQFSESLLNQLQRSDRRALEGILPLVGVACKYNPRATVRFVNNLLIDKAIHWALLGKEHAEEDAEQIPILYFAITRALQQGWWSTFSLLYRSPALCDTIAGWSPDELQDHAKSEDEQEALVASRLLTDPDLRALLLNYGIPWLENHQKRESAVQFIREQRPDTGSVATKDVLPPDAILLYDLRDQNQASQIVRILARSDIEVWDSPTTMVDPDVYIPTIPAIWMVGSDWQIWEEKGRPAESFPSGHWAPVFFVLLPQAADTTLPDRVRNRMVLRLPEEIREKNLMPLIRELRGLHSPRKVIRMLS